MLLGCILCVFWVGFSWDRWWWRGLFVLTTIHVDWHCINRLFRIPTNDPYLISLFLFSAFLFFFLPIFCMKVLRKELVDFNELPSRDVLGSTYSVRQFYLSILISIAIECWFLHKYYIYLKSVICFTVLPLWRAQQEARFTHTLHHF